MVRRKIIEIDEERCDGCGLCVPSCAEGAIAIVDGKARLVSDVYCDGLGACLGQCPKGAIRIIEREAAAFDPQATHPPGANLPLLDPVPRSEGPACPGLVGQPSHGAEAGTFAESRDRSSALANWPIQLQLIPASAPFLKDADLLLVADCVPFALADFHQRYLAGRRVVIACPKLDRTQPYVEKLAAIFRQSGIRSVTVMHMEVPCCTGLVRLAETARQMAAAEIPLAEVVVSTRGQVLRDTSPGPSRPSGCPGNTQGPLTR